MIKTITIEWLQSQGACEEAIKAWHRETDHDTFATLNRLANKNPEWGNWLICTQMNKNQVVRYAIFAAEQVVDIYEGKYPDDKRPRNAIEAAKAYLKNPCAKTKAAADAAYAAAYTAYVDADSDGSIAAADAAYASYAAADAAVYAGYAAYAAIKAAVNAAVYVAYATTYTVDAAANERRKMQAKILKYGIGLLK